MLASFKELFFLIFVFSTHIHIIHIFVVASSIDRCLHYLSRAGGYHLIELWTRTFFASRDYLLSRRNHQYGLRLEARFSRDLEPVGFEPGAAGYQSTTLPQSYRASVLSNLLFCKFSPKSKSGRYTTVYNFEKLCKSFYWKKLFYMTFSGNPVF